MSTPIGNSPVVIYGTALVYKSGNEEYFAGTAVGFVLGGGGALVLDTGKDGLVEFTKQANEHLYLARDRFDEVVAERDDLVIKARGLTEELEKAYQEIDALREELRGHNELPQYD